MRGIVRIVWARVDWEVGRRTLVHHGRCTTWLRADPGHPAHTDTTLHQCPRFGVRSESGYKSQCTDLLISGHRRHGQVGGLSQCLRSVACHCITKMSASRRCGRGRSRAAYELVHKGQGGRYSTGVLREKGHILWSARRSNLHSHSRLHEIHLVISNAISV